IVPEQRFAGVADRALRTWAGRRGRRSVGLAGGFAPLHALARSATLVAVLALRGGDQQRRVALHGARQRRGDLRGRHVVLALVALDQVAVARKIRAAERAGDAVQELAHAALVHRLHAGQLHRLDLLPRGALDRAEHAALARCGEQDRLAAAPGASGAADPV